MPKAERSRRPNKVSDAGCYRPIMAHLGGFGDQGKKLPSLRFISRDGGVFWPRDRQRSTEQPPIVAAQGHFHRSSPNGLAYISVWGRFYNRNGFS